MISDADIDQIAVGDVIKVGSMYRTVRSVGMKDGRPYYFAFSIQRCSWTHRPYTILCRSDLRTRSFAVYKARRRVRSTAVERRLQDCIESENGSVRVCDCCDVRGKVF